MDVWSAALYVDVHPSLVAGHLHRLVAVTLADTGLQGYLVQVGSSIKFDKILIWNYFHGLHPLANAQNSNDSDIQEKIAEADYRQN